MKKIIPFNKNIIFQSNVSEITSISLEHTLHVENDHLINGDFIISGEYLMTDNSTETEYFSYTLPFEINYDEKYDLSNVSVDIDDFYYEIVNDNMFHVDIEVRVDKLVLKELEEVNRNVVEIESEEKSNIREDVVDSINENEIINMEVDEEKEDNQVINTTNIFETIDDTENYVTYKVYIVREEDTVETIMTKYNISKDRLELYNNIENINKGDKLIIPCADA